MTDRQNCGQKLFLSDFAIKLYLAYFYYFTENMSIKKYTLYVQVVRNRTLFHLYQNVSESKN